MIWFSWVLWHINHCWLFNAKSSLYIYIKYIWFGLVRFYGISNIVGYLMPNPLYTYILTTYDLYRVVLWHINHCWLSNAKSCFYKYIKYIWFSLVGFYGISTIYSLFNAKSCFYIYIKYIWFVNTFYRYHSQTSLRSFFFFFLQTVTWFQVSLHKSQFNISHLFAHIVYSIWLTVLPLQVRVDLRVMTMKGCSTFPTFPNISKAEATAWVYLMSCQDQTLQQRCSRCIFQFQPTWLKQWIAVVETI